jgi:hypothetical protein
MGVQINGDTGNVIATKGTFSGDVGIGGTLTYEDVTNIDAVGLVTARSGIEIGARPGVGASISVDGNAIFSGITTVGGRIDTTDTTDGALNATFTRGADTAFQLQFRNHRTSNSPRSGVGSFGVFRGDNDIVGLRFMRGTGATGAGSLAVTQAGVEKVRVDYTGHVGIGSTQPVKQLTIFSGSGDNGGILVQPNAIYGNSQNRAYLIAGTPNWTGATTDWGTYGFQHRFKSTSSGVARVTIDSVNGEAFCVNTSNNIGIGTDSPDGRLHISSGASGDCRVYIEADEDNNAEGDNPFIIFKQDGGIETASVWCGNADGGNDNSLNLSSATSQYGGIRFFTSSTDGGWETADERLRIAPNGKIGINTITANSRLHILAGNEGGILIEDSSTNTQAPYLEIIGKRLDGNTHQSFAGQVFLAKNRTDAKTAAGVKLGVVLFGGNHTNGSKSNIAYPASIVGISENSFDSVTDMPTGIAFYTGSTGRAPAVNNVSSGVERLRITSDGYLLLATDSQKNLGQGNTDTGIGLNPLGRVNASRDGAASILINRNNSAGPIQVFYLDGVQEGYIQIATSGISMVNTSDYRLKENETIISDGITKVKQLIPRRFNFKADKDTTVDGFFAHEVSPVVPESVFGEKDATINEEGEGYQGLDQSKLIPVLTASIKELIAKVETLEAEVAALKSN